MVFEIEVFPGAQPSQTTKRVVDHERSVSLVCAYFGDPESTPVFRLEINESVIPFTATWSGRPAGFKSRLKHHLHWKIEPARFGSAAIVPGGSIPKHVFAKDGERAEAGLLAVEALLAFGFAYNGNKLDGVSELTVEFDGRIFSKRDFPAV